MPPEQFYWRSPVRGFSRRSGGGRGENSRSGRILGRREAELRKIPARDRNRVILMGDRRAVSGHDVRIRAWIPPPRTVGLFLQTPDGFWGEA